FSRAVAGGRHGRAPGRGAGCPARFQQALSHHRSHRRPAVAHDREFAVEGGPAMATSVQWQLAHDAAVRYEQILVPSILGPFARALVDWAQLPVGDTVLDVGCGTGAAARAAAERVGPAGSVTAVDVNPGMLDVARSLPPVRGAPITWREGSAYQLPLPDRSVEHVICAQTLQFLETPGLALAEMHRVLKAGGRVALSVWCPIRENPYFHALVDAVAHYIDPDTAMGLGAA